MPNLGLATFLPVARFVDPARRRPKSSVEEATAREDRPADGAVVKAAEVPMAARKATAEIFILMRFETCKVSGVGWIGAG